MPLPSIETTRLTLRPFSLSDAPVVQEFAGKWEIADTTLNIPHPYEDGMAEEWIGSHESGFSEGTDVTFAVERRDDNILVGAVGLRVDRDLNKAELGYWIGKPFWNRGYATEATVAILDFGFGELELNRIQAGHLARNPASGRVMQKSGMVLEGTARQATVKWDRYEDLVFYAVLREDWLSKSGN